MAGELWQAAAMALSGKRVEVRFRRPVIANFSGQAYNKGGQAVIDIDPQLGEDDRLYVFCHECAHIHLKHAAQGDPDQQPGSIQYTSAAMDLYRKHHPVVVRVEREADDLAARWLAYAEQNWRRYGNSGDPVLTRKLRCLTYYIDPAIQALVHRAAERGAAKALEFYFWKLEQEKLFRR